MTDSPLDGLSRVGGVIVLFGPAAQAALQAVKIAVRARKANGAPHSRVYAALAVALAAAVAEAGQTDTTREPVLETSALRTVPAGEAAELLGCSVRTVRRLARQLGGHKVGGQWQLDAQAVEEHLEGHQR
jgi:excisionase family DNA binding protein